MPPGIRPARNEILLEISRSLAWIGSYVPTDGGWRRKLRLTGDSHRPRRCLLPGDGEVSTLTRRCRGHCEASVERVVEVCEAACSPGVLVRDLDDLGDPSSVRAVDIVLEESDKLDALA